MKKLLLGIFLFFITSSVFATDNVITIGKGWSVFSTPKILSDISFSNTDYFNVTPNPTGAGLTFYTLENGVWQSVAVSPTTIKPLNGYMVYNSTQYAIFANLNYKGGVTPGESLFSKTLNAGWNLLGVTSQYIPFSTIGQNATMGVDFTYSKANGNGAYNIVSDYNTYIGNSYIANIATTLGESYGIFMSQSGVYGGNQSLDVDPYYIVETKRDNLDTQYISLNTGSLINKTLYKGKITANNVEDLRLAIARFTLDSVTSNNDEGLVKNIRLIVNGSLISTNEYLTSEPDGFNGKIYKIIFDNLNVIIPKGGSIDLEIIGDFDKDYLSAGKTFQVYYDGQNGIYQPDGFGFFKGVSSIMINNFNGPMYEFTGSANNTSIMWESETGEYIGQGLNKTFDTAHGYNITNNANTGSVTFYFSNSDIPLVYNASFSSQDGKTLLEKGKYYPAIRDPFRNGSNGINIDGAGRGCNTILGGFYVHDYALNNNTLESAAIDFVQYCEGDTSRGLYGSIRYNSSIPSSCDTNGCASVRQLGIDTPLTMIRNDGIADQAIAIGSSSQTLTQFTMSANDTSYIDINSMIFTQTGASNVSSSNVTNVRLMIDGLTVSTKNMASGSVNFNDINLGLGKNTSVTVKVVADFSTAITPGQKFQVGLSAITAIDSNANTLDSSSITKPSNGILYTFVKDGSATISLNSSTPTAMILTPASSEMELARYTIAAQDDDLRLTDLYIKNNGTADLSTSIKSIGLYDTNGNKLALGSKFGTGTIQFHPGSSFVIPKNTSNSVIIVKASFDDLTDASVTNKTVQLAIGNNFTIPPESGTVNGARFVSETTGYAITSVTSSSAVANTHLLARSRPVVAISTSATASTHTFTVTADANNRITLASTTFSITNPSGLGGTFTLYKDSENSGNVISTGSISTNGVISFGGFIPTEISPGTSKTFIFKVSPELQSAPVNSKRIFRIQDLSYTDMMNTGGNVTIPTISTYSNVGLPSVESTFTY
ncbi:MAG: hypothetical protein WC850_05420 [Candidatus Gracilibacteria bacterium]